jgi:hypothetical protein
MVTPLLCRTSGYVSPPPNNFTSHAGGRIGLSIMSVTAWMVQPRATPAPLSASAIVAATSPEFINDLSLF